MLHVDDERVAVCMDFAAGVLTSDAFLTAAITGDLSGKGEAQRLFDSQRRERYKEGQRNHTHLLQLGHKAVIETSV